jgi:hypothetical protein
MRLNRSGTPVVPFFLIIVTSIGLLVLLIMSTPSCTYEELRTLE